METDWEDREPWQMYSSRNENGKRLESSWMDVVKAYANDEQWRIKRKKREENNFCVCEKYQIHFLKNWKIVIRKSIKSETQNWNKM